jgi:hypothetical protein
MKKVTIMITLAILLAVHAFSQSFQWARQVTGNESEYIYDMTTDASGNIYVVGAFAGTITLGGTTYTAADSDIWLAKYNSSGGFIWGKVITDTGTSTGKDVGRSIALDANNNVYICGDYNYQKNFNPGGTGGTTPNNPNMHFIAKYTSSGGFQWVKTIQTGGSFFNAIAFSPAQNRIYIGGNFNNYNNDVDFDPSPTGVLTLDDADGQTFIASYTLNGAVVNAENFGASSDIKDLAIDPAGNVYATGYLSGSSINLNPAGPGTSFDPANGRMFVAKYNANIDYISASQITGGGTNDEGLSIIAPANDQIFYGGRVNDGLYLARRDSDFNPVYEKYYGGSGAVTAITTDDSSLYFSASSSSNTSIDLGNGVSLNPVNQGGDILLAKTSLTGLANWGATIPISNTNFAIPPTSTSIKAIGSNEFILAGYFNGSTDFNACANSTSLTANSTDGFMVRYSGEDWSKGIGPISGPSLVCSSGVSFSVSGLEPGVSISWTKSDNLTYVSGQNTATYTVKAASGAQGEGWVQAAVTGPCGSITLPIHTVWVGTPTITYLGKTGPCYEPILSYEASRVDGATYSWSINTNKLIVTSNGYFADVSNNGVLDGESESFVLTVTITEGECTYTESKSGEYYQPTICDCGYDDPSCGGSDGPPSTLSIYPVPSADQITISVKSEKGNSEEVIKEVALFNHQQTLVLQESKINKKEFVIDVKQFPQGLYFLHITTQKGIRERQIIVE